MKFSMSRDVNGFNGFGLNFSDIMYNTTLADGVEQHFTIPIGSVDSPRFLAIFSYEPGGVVWVANNNTASGPGVSFATTLSELNPTARVVKSGDVLSFITTDTTLEVGVTLYELSSAA
jgi:hypothetical protein